MNDEWIEGPGLIKKHKLRNMFTISSENLSVPSKTIDTPFKSWVNVHNYHLRNLYAIFIDELNVEELYDNKYYLIFLEYIYKKSSRII